MTSTLNTRERIFADDTLDLVSELINMGSYDEAESLILWEVENRDDAIKGMEILGYSYAGICETYNSPKMRRMIRFENGAYEMHFDSWIDVIDTLYAIVENEDVTEKQYKEIHNLDAIKRI